MSAIYQRTESGRHTILTKSVKLTQSERLILILVDGVSTLQALREKTWAVSDERFHRALNTLLSKDLIYEVLLPLPGQEQEALDQAVMDRFLQQDPLDPITIIAIDPEDTFGDDLMTGHGMAGTAARQSVQEPGMALPSLAANAVGRPDAPAGDEAHCESGTVNVSGVVRAHLTTTPLDPLISQSPPAPQRNPAATFAFPAVTSAINNPALAMPLPAPAATASLGQFRRDQDDTAFPANWPENTFDDDELDDCAPNAPRRRPNRNYFLHVVRIVLCAGVALGLLVIIYQMASALIPTG
jgi:hypothetical protein